MNVTTGYEHDTFVRDSRQRNNRHERLIAHFRQCFPDASYGVHAKLAQTQSLSEELGRQLAGMSHVARRFIPWP
jgi:hypothetical protein